MYAGPRLMPWRGSVLKPARRCPPSRLRSRTRAPRVRTQDLVVCGASPRRHRLRPPVASRAGRFRGAEYRIAPLPTHQAFSRFGLASLDGTNRQALAGLSWLSCSRPPDFPGVPGPGQGPVPAVARRELPTPARLNGPAGLSPDLPLAGGCGPDPRGGISTGLTGRTRFI